MITAFVKSLFTTIILTSIAVKSLAQQICPRPDNRNIYTTAKTYKGVEVFAARKASDNRWYIWKKLTDGCAILIDESFDYIKDFNFAGDTLLVISSGNRPSVQSQNTGAPDSLFVSWRKLPAGDSLLTIPVLRIHNDRFDSLGFIGVDRVEVPHTFYIHSNLNKNFNAKFHFPTDSLKLYAVSTDTVIIARDLSQNSNKLFVCKKESGKNLIPGAYDEVMRFSNRVIRVKEGLLYTYYRFVHKDSVAPPQQYNSPGEFISNAKYAVARSGNDSVIINANDLTSLKVPGTLKLVKINPGYEINGQQDQDRLYAQSTDSSWKTYTIKSNFSLGTALDMGKFNTITPVGGKFVLAQKKEGDPYKLLGLRNGIFEEIKTANKKTLILPNDSLYSVCLSPSNNNDLIIVFKTKKDYSAYLLTIDQVSAEISLLDRGFIITDTVSYRLNYDFFITKHPSLHYRVISLLTNKKVVDLDKEVLVLKGIVPVTGKKKNTYWVSAKIEGADDYSTLELVSDD